MPSLKYGFKLVCEKEIVFASESSETFKKWFFALRKLTILEKFSRKYKAL